ncbi:MAG: hypothetical protein NTU83_03400 [Candidatus Hydrogenedentes bacterium]|nr:hypothetical protein [Candidatus Hydrogenedentota bacterium]
MIAAYEAEMNVVIHAYRGVINVAASPELLDVIVADEGPGIADIELAMRDGYSTAPEAARELGFGAGMGLAHIKKNSDHFSLQSKVGEGTRLRFSIFLQPEVSDAVAANSVAINGDLCRKCLRCLHACPTGAVRVRQGRPEILPHLCVDCTSCAEACESSALYAEGLRDIPTPQKKTVLVLPGSFLEQFGATISPGQILGILADMGFRQIRLIDEWENGLRSAVAKYARDEAPVKPVLSPMCPAVVNLIQIRFPSLLPNVAPFLTPIEMAREDLTAPHAVFLAVCPAQVTVLRRKNAMTRIEIVHPAALRDAVLRRVLGPAREGRRNVSAHPFQDAVEVGGMRHVMKVLDAVENGQARNFSVIEMSACYQACFGSPVWTEDPSITRPRYEWERASHLLLLKKEAEIVRRVDTLAPRAGLRLDADIGTAIEKLGAIDALTKTLPGRDCGVCGAPTCTSLAEDVVLGRAKGEACVYRNVERKHR